MKLRRIQLSRAKGWRMPPNTVCAHLMPRCDPADFELWLTNALEKHAETRQAIERFRGKNLACWCALDQPCDADVLLRLANKDIKT